MAMTWRIAGTELFDDDDADGYYYLPLDNERL